MAKARLCSVDKCDKPHYGKSLCKLHYRRAQRGLPMDYVSTRHVNPVEKRDFCEIDCMSFEDEDACLTWPYARDPDGYGILSVKGKTIKASRYVCILAHGEPPTPKHHAAHSCGNGHNACVSKHHISWKTPKENILDKFDHGTMPMGSKNQAAKLDEDKVMVIRAMKGKLSIGRLAKMFNVGLTTVEYAQKGKNWGPIYKAPPS